MRTSHTDPIRIAEIPYPGSTGYIGVTFCPGKKQRDGMSGHWERDLAIDLDAIAARGSSTVVTLVEPAELIELGVESRGAEVKHREMRWLHLPIVDRHAPSAEWNARWLEVRDGLHDELSAGKRILVHCKGGLGRAGTVAARLLIEAGMTSIAAMALVRDKRKKAIETVEQEGYLLSLSIQQLPGRKRLFARTAR